MGEWFIIVYYGMSVLTLVCDYPSIRRGTKVFAVYRRDLVDCYMDELRIYLPGNNMERFYDTFSEQVLALKDILGLSSLDLERVWQILLFLRNLKFFLNLCICYFFLTVLKLSNIYSLEWQVRGTYQIIRITNQIVPAILYHGNNSSAKTHNLVESNSGFVKVELFN